MEYILDERGVHEDVGDGEIGGADYHVYGGILSSRGHERDEPQIRNPTKVSERCGPNRQECDFSSLD